MTEIINHNRTQCQAIYDDSNRYNSEIYKLGREFFQECTQFVKNINFLDDSPWKNDGIVRWARSEQGIKLGTAQETVLRFLQQKYFISNQPCFAKQSYLGYKLRIERSHINRILKSLEKKNLIIKIQWLYKGRRQNSLILPLIPSLTPFFNNPECQKIAFQANHTTCDTLFCKPLKGQKYPTPYILYTNVIYSNILFKSNKVKLNNILPDRDIYSNEYPTETVGSSLPNVLVPKLVINNTETKNVASKTTHVDSTDVDSKKVASKTNTLGSKLVNLVERKNTPMLDRFLLKRKDNSNPSIYKPIFDKLKEHDYEFDCLSVSQQNELNTYFEFYYFINIRTHFKISKNLGRNKGYIDRAIQIRRKFLQIIADDFELQWDHATKIIEYWNASKIDDSRFKRIKINSESKTYKNAVITISHCLIYQAKRNINKLYKAIDRLSRSHSTRNYPFQHVKALVTISDFFSNLNNGNKYDNIAYLESDIEFERWIMKSNIIPRHRKRVNIAFNCFSEMYINQFYSNNKENGKEICYKFEFMIKRFLQERICEIVDVKSGKNPAERVMHGYSLVEERSNNGHNISPLLQRYLFYIYKNPTIGNDGFLLTNICKHETWVEFIETHMRIEVGLNDFYKVKRRDK